MAEVGSIFISHASQDEPVATAVCKALEDAGLRCWIAPRDVRAGDFYADAIVQAINSCPVLVVILSGNAIDSAHVLREVERASAKKRPIISIHTDATPLPPGLEYFLSASHWLDASQGPLERVIPSLIDAVRAHCAASATASGPVPPVPRRETPASRSRAVVAVAVALMAAALLYLVAGKIWLSRRAPVAAAATPSPVSASAAAPATFSPPPHSVAVLPFVNMSGDPKQDYFSDGLSEELLNSLAAVRGLQVAARTSAFSFKGKQVDVAEIARALNVGAVLEGSVRKEGEHVRITAQLINAVTGFHLWSKTYDRDLTSVLKLQTEVANEVSTALQATLLNTVETSLDSGGTDNPQAFDAYLRAERQVSNGGQAVTAADFAAAASDAVREYSEAIRLDPQFANAYVGKASALLEIQRLVPHTGREARTAANDALAAAKQATALAPHLGAAHAALAEVQSRLFLDFGAAESEYERALELAPGDARVLTRAALFLAQMGRFDQALPDANRAAALDPLNAVTQNALADFFYAGHRYKESVEAGTRAEEIDPHTAFAWANIGVTYLATGNIAAALRACTTPPIEENHQFCLAITYDKLHRQADAEAALATLQSTAGSAWAYQYSEVYAQWGDVPKALEWLETALRLMDPGLLYLKTDSLVDPLRQEPRFQAIYAKLRFPS
jgi:TolB-like protein/tetratricopeptide (TPR) repeat protein